MSHRQEALRLVELLDETPYSQQPRLFFSQLKTTSLPYLGCQEPNPKQVFLQLLEVVYLLGRGSLPLTVAFCQHLYVVTSLGQAPFPSDHPLALKRGRIVADLKKHRLLVTVSTFAKGLTGGEAGIELKPGEKGFLASGQALCQSLDGEADLIGLTGRTPEGHGFFLVSFKHAQIGERVIGGPMEQTDTRCLSLEGAPVGRPLAGDDRQTWNLLHYQTAWFQSLVSAAYLGAASRVLDESRALLLRASGPHDGPMAELDAVVMRMGRLVLALTTAWSSLRYLGHRFSSIDLTTSTELLDRTSVQKQTTQRACLQIVDGVRDTLGPMAYRPDTLLERLLLQLPYLANHPLLPLEVERDLGFQVLSKKEFVGLDWHC